MRGHRKSIICACCLQPTSVECDIDVCKTLKCPDRGDLPHTVEVTEEAAEKLRYGRRMLLSKVSDNKALELKLQREGLEARHYKELCEALGVKD